MPKRKLTKTVVEQAVTEHKDLVIWDTEIPGFGLKATSKGSRSYFLFYRTAGGVQRKPKIGQHGQKRNTAPHPSTSCCRRVSPSRLRLVVS